MRRFVVLAIAVFALFSVFSQDVFDQLVSTKTIDCSDISYNSGQYFVKYMTENKVDSAKSLLSYWESKCGIREPIYRAKILLALQTQQFDELLMAEKSLANIFNYQSRMEMIKHTSYYSYDNYKPYYGFIPPGQDFDKFTQNLALELKENYHEGSVEYILTEFYGDNPDTIFSKIQTGQYDELPLAKEYNEAVRQYVNLAEGHMSLIVGAWIPTGQLNILGVHPEIGFQLGAKKKKMSYDLTMSFRFLDSANYYYAQRNNVKELTKHFFGGYIGFDIGRDIYAKNRHELQVLGGIAFDGFDALEEDKDNDLESQSTWSYNFNVGLGYRYYVKDHYYIGLRAKYNIVDYSLNNVVDFTGNPITIQFVIGGLNNAYRNENLKALKYKIRK